MNWNREVNGVIKRKRRTSEDARKWQICRKALMTGNWRNTDKL